MTVVFLYDPLNAIFIFFRFRCFYFLGMVTKSSKISSSLCLEFALGICDCIIHLVIFAIIKFLHKNNYSYKVKYIIINWFKLLKMRNRSKE